MLNKFFSGVDDDANEKKNFGSVVLCCSFDEWEKWGKLKNCTIQLANCEHGLWLMKKIYRRTVEPNLSRRKSIQTTLAKTSFFLSSSSSYFLVCHLSHRTQKKCRTSFFEWKLTKFHTVHCAMRQQLWDLRNSMKILKLFLKFFSVLIPVVYYYRQCKRLKTNNFSILIFLFSFFFDILKHCLHNLSHAFNDGPRTNGAKEQRMCVYSVCI